MRLQRERSRERANAYPQGMSSQEPVVVDAESQELARLMGERLERGFILSSFASELAGKAQRDEL